VFEKWLKFQKIIYSYSAVSLILGLGLHTYHDVKDHHSLMDDCDGAITNGEPLNEIQAFYDGAGYSLMILGLVGLIVGLVLLVKVLHKSKSTDHVPPRSFISILSFVIFCHICLMGLGYLYMNTCDVIS